MSEQLIQTPGVFGEHGNFLLERELGAGGMGGVYMGRDKMLDRPVAVKVMLKELGADADFVEKFKKEAQSAARLIHPNIAQVYSYGICDGMPYIAMELASGGSLYSLMNANPGKTDVARVLKICQQVAQALQCASDQGCVHGDVKPENILLDANGNAKLVDFGLAGMQKDTNEIWGTPYYISPEKVKKEPVDFRADMYSLGGTLYHALTGVAPFEGEDSIAVVKKRFEGPPKKPSEVRPGLSAAIDDLVMRMLALNKEDRYPSFEALLDAFKNVLTTGLTSQIPAAAQPTTAKTTSTVRRTGTALRSRRMAMRRTGTTTIRKTIDGETGDEGARDESSASGSEEDEEEGGSLGAKVVGVVVGVIVLVALVVGGLFWYMSAAKRGQEAEEKAQIASGIQKADDAIRDTVANALKFADEFDEFAARAITECQKPTDELKKILPEEVGLLLKPGPSKELLDAIAATNETPAAAAPAAASAAATNAPAAASAATNAPPAKADAKSPATNAAPAKAEGDAKEEKKAEPTPQVVITMNELWERAYGCQASAVRIRHAVRKIATKGAEVDALKAQGTHEAMDQLGKLSRIVAEMFEEVRASKDVENVKKGITYIKTKGESTVKQTMKRLRIEKLEAERKARAEAAAAAEKDRQEKLAAEKKAKIEEESKAAADKFEMITAQGCLRQLDWKTAIRQLETLKDEMTTAEGQLAVDLQIRKVNDMKKVQDLLIAQMPGKGSNKPFVFHRSPLRGQRVARVNDKEIELERPGAKPSVKNKSKITWQRFYKDNNANFFELVNHYIYNGRKTCGLSMNDVADALTGAALTFQLVFAEDDNTPARVKTLALQAVKEFPDYVKTAKEIFPDVEFPEAE